jgi:hypothetical protein
MKAIRQSIENNYQPMKDEVNSNSLSSKTRLQRRNNELKHTKKTKTECSMSRSVK